MSPAYRPDPTTSLRATHRALTRTRIMDASRELLFTAGVEATTMDGMAQAAGVSRSTLYVHFPDKLDVLAGIAEEYGAALVQIIGHLPSPAPTRSQIGAWIDELAGFIVRARMPAMLIADLAEQEDAPASILAIQDKLLAALAARLPRFGRALANAATRDLAQAWAQMVMRDLGWACLRQARKGGGRQDRALLIVAGDIFERFVHLDHGSAAL